MHNMSYKKFACGCALACIAFAQGAFAVPEPKNVPELMTTSKGEKVTTVEQWEKIRAPELFALFEREEYGRRPAAANARDRVSFDVYDVSEALGGKAVRKLVRVTYRGPNGTFSFPFTAFIPKTKKPVPAFVLAANIKRGTEEGAFVGVLAGRGNHRARLRDRRVPVRLRGGG